MIFYVVKLHVPSVTAAPLPDVFGYTNLKWNLETKVVSRTLLCSREEEVGELKWEERVGGGIQVREGRRQTREKHFSFIFPLVFPIFLFFSATPLSSSVNIFP